MKIIKPFGPTLAKVKIPKNIINKINLEVDKIINSKKLTKKNDYSKRVVGQVYQEIRLPDKFTNNVIKKFQKFLMTDNQKNVLGENLEDCSLDPLTGWYRDGCCKTDENDKGVHTVCAKVNDDFLNWCKEAGNDLVTPHPEFGFPGLKNGDSWCVCAGWFAKAVDAGKGCPIYLKKTHENTLKLIPIETLKKFAIDLS